MLREDVATLLVTYGWISVGNYMYAKNGYTINLMAYDRLRGFMINHDDGKRRVWVSENELESNFLISFFLRYVGEVNKILVEG